MKKCLYTILLVLTITCIVYSQERGRAFEKRLFNDDRALKKIEQMERMKLIELLDLDEETSLRFFARRNEHLKKVKSIFYEKENLILDLKKNIEGKEENDSYYKEQINKLLEFENRMVKEKENYYKSLLDILTPQQIAKLTVFEFMFRRELTHTVIKKKIIDQK